MAKKLDDVIESLDLARRARIDVRAKELANLKGLSTDAKQSPKELTPAIGELGHQAPM